MNRPIAFRHLFPALALLTLFVVACSDDGAGGTDPSTGGSGATADGGDSSGGAGGTLTGGGAQGGEDGGGAGGEDGGAQHCSDMTTSGFDGYLTVLKNCGQGVRHIELDEPIGPGDTLAFSVELVTTPGGTMELYGATEDCGEPMELLATAPMGEALRCMEVSPKEGTYTHLIWNWNGGGSHMDFAICPGVTCPR